MLLIDYEKAYNRVKWSFLLMMLEEMGFPTMFSRMVSTLLNGVMAAVHINGLNHVNLN